ncbi:MAG TPA: glycosyltransferase family 4 protein [Sphingomonas sp.]|nr:glycosyltransferase family 4 protein [Sphingomonas sp.]
MTRVLVVSSLALSLVNFRGRLLRALVDAGYTVEACAPDHDPAVVAALADMGVTFRQVPMARAGLNPIADLRTLFALIRAIVAWRPDIVLAYTQKPIAYAGIATRLVGRARFFAMVSGLGHAFSDTGSRTRPLLARLVALLFRAALARAVAVFVFNADDRGELIRQGMITPHHRVLLLPGSGVDLEHFATSAVPTGAPVFLMIARLLKSKGLEEFVAAARIVRARSPDARFHLVGAIDANPDSVGAAALRAWQDEGAIRYLGETRDVRPHLADATVFVLPSWYREGLPRTILEAMATGRAVITTDMPGCRDPIDAGVNGIIVPPRDAGALAHACLRFVDDPALARRMGSAARRIAEDRYAVERVNAEILHAFDPARFGRPGPKPATSTLAELTT